MFDLGPLLFDVAFEMIRPGKLHQQPHQERCRDGKAALIEKPDGNKAKDERMGRAPKPKVLVQEVERNNRNDQQCSFHRICFTGFVSFFRIANFAGTTI